MTKNILIVGQGPSYKNNEIFKKDSKYNRDNSFDVAIFLKEYLKTKNINLSTYNPTDAKYADAIIFFDYYFFQTEFLECIKKGYKKKMILFIFEPEVVRPSSYKKIHHLFFSVVYTWRDDLVSQSRYRKFYWPQVINKVHKIPFSKKRLLTLINANKYSLRKDEVYSKRVNISYFLEEHTNDFNLYGYGWNQKHYNPLLIYHLLRDFRFIRIKQQWNMLKQYIFGKPPLKSYKGGCTNKYDVLARHKFAICFENQENVPGYFTEKLFDCLQSYCIPIYLGASNIEKYIPPEAYIDYRKFNNNSELMTYITTMTEKEYNKRIQAIEKYLKTFNTKTDSPFSKENFAITVHRAIKKIIK